jgi:hypothetical protein
MFHRYGGGDDPLVRRLERFAGEDAAQMAKTIGLALRAAMVLAGPAAELLRETSVKLTPNALVVNIPKAHQALVGEAIAKRLDALAKVLDRVTRVELR